MTTVKTTKSSSGYPVWVTVARAVIPATDLVGMQGQMSLQELEEQQFGLSLDCLVDGSAYPFYLAAPSFPLCDGVCCETDGTVLFFLPLPFFMHFFSSSFIICDRNGRHVHSDALSRNIRVSDCVALLFFR